MFLFFVFIGKRYQKYRHTRKSAENTYFHTEHTCFEVSHLLTFSRYEGDDSISFEIEGKQDPYREKCRYRRPVPSAGILTQAYESIPLYGVCSILQHVYVQKACVLRNSVGRKVGTHRGMLIEVC